MDDKNNFDVIDEPYKAKRKPSRIPDRISIRTSWLAVMALMLVALGLGVVIGTGLNPPHVQVVTATVSPTATALMITPTMIFDARYWPWEQPVALADDFRGYAAGTQVRITSAYYNGREWYYNVQVVLDGVPLEVPQPYLTRIMPTEPPRPPATPTARFDQEIGMGRFALVVTVDVGSLSAGTPVRVSHTSYDGADWLYFVVASDGESTAQVYEWQLDWVPGYGPGQPTPMVTPG